MGKQGHNQLTDVDVFSKGLLHTNETLDEDMDKYNDIQVKDNDNIRSPHLILLYPS